MTTPPGRSTGPCSIEEVSRLLDHSSLSITTTCLRRLVGQEDHGWGRVAEAIGVWKPIGSHHHLSFEGEVRDYARFSQGDIGDHFGHAPCWFEAERPLAGLHSEAYRGDSSRRRSEL
jgi:hypothetical protein